MKFVVAAVSATPILWRRGSALPTPPGSPASTPPGLGNGAGARQYRFEKCGFTALERAHQCDAPGTSGTSGVLSHRRLLIWSSARDWVGVPIVSGVLRLGKREK